MATYTLPSVVVLLPLLLVGAVIGYRRAWGREIITGLALAVVLLGFEVMTGFVRASLGALARFVAGVMDAVDVAGPPLERSIASVPAGLLTLTCLVLFVVAAYWLGGALGQQAGESRLRRLSGAAMGAVNALLVVAIASAQAERIVGRAALQRLFLVPGSRRGVELDVLPFPSSGALGRWTAYALFLLVLVAVVLIGGWGISRLSRFRR